MAKKHPKSEPPKHYPLSQAKAAEMRDGMLRIQAAILAGRKAGVSSASHLDSIARDMAEWAGWLDE